MNQKKFFKIVIALIVVLAVMAGMYAIFRHFSPKTQAGEKHITISIVFDDGSEKKHEIDTSAEFLKEALESVAEISGEESEYGYTLYSIDGVTADFTQSNAYWAIYVNGEYGTYGLSQQPLTDGDVYTIAYEVYTES